MLVRGVAVAQDLPRGLRDRDDRRRAAPRRRRPRARRAGSQIVVNGYNGEPATVVDALEAAGDRLTDVRLHQMLAPRHGRRSTAGSRDCATSRGSCPPRRARRSTPGHCDLVPNNFSDVPRLLRRSVRPDLVVAVRVAARPARLLLAGHRRHLHRGVHRRAPVLRRGQRADAAHLRRQPAPHQRHRRLVRGRPAPRPGPAARAHPARPHDRRARRRPHPGRRHAAGRDRRGPGHGARRPRRPPRAGRAQRGVRHRLRRPRRTGASSPAPGRPRTGGRSSPRRRWATRPCTTSSPTTPGSSSTPWTTPTTRGTSPANRCSAR